MVFYLHFNTSVFSKMLLVTCYFWLHFPFFIFLKIPAGDSAGVLRP